MSILGPLPGKRNLLSGAELCHGHPPLVDHRREHPGAEGGDGQLSPRLYQSPQVGDQPWHVFDEEHPEHTDHNVELAFGEVESGHVSHPELDLIQVEIAGFAAGDVKHRLGIVNRQHRTLGADRNCGGDGRGAGTTGNVEHPQPGLQGKSLHGPLRRETPVEAGCLLVDFGGGTVSRLSVEPFGLFNHRPGSPC